MLKIACILTLICTAAKTFKKGMLFKRWWDRMRKFTKLFAKLKNINMPGLNVCVVVGK